jgi:hypothetical protein
MLEVVVAQLTTDPRRAELIIIASPLEAEVAVVVAVIQYLLQPTQPVA